ASGGGQKFRRQMDGIDGRSKIVPQHAEKPIAVLGLTSEIGRHNFGDALIDSFIESDHRHRFFAETFWTAPGPQAQNAGAERAIFRDYLRQIEPRLDAQPNVGGSDTAQWTARSQTLALGGLLVECLRPPDIFSDGLE